MINLSQVFDRFVEREQTDQFLHGSERFFNGCCIKLIILQFTMSVETTFNKRLGNHNGNFRANTEKCCFFFVFICHLKVYIMPNKLRIYLTLS